MAPLDLDEIRAQTIALKYEVDAFAVVSSFATRNPVHEKLACEVILETTDRPVTCSHQLSAKLNGPKRALTAVLNAKLVGKIAQLIAACEQHMERLKLNAPLMVVRGDGALISAEMVRERPIETILSGPAASIVGARWLTGKTDALVSDIGGTTTDVALLRNGLPEIDPNGASVGGHRTMVEAVAMRTTGLGGDSEVHVFDEEKSDRLRLGPRRLVSVSLLACEHPEMVNKALERALATEPGPEHGGRFAIPLGGEASGIPQKERELLSRIDAPIALVDLLKTRMELILLDKLVARGLVILSGVTPSDACHVLGRLNNWNVSAAEKALRLMAKKRINSGKRVAQSATALAHMIVEQLTEQTSICLLEAAFAEDPAFSEESPTALARHLLTRAGNRQHKGIIEASVRFGVPVVGLGASAANYYPAVGDRVGCKMILPEHSGVANAIGAVVGQIRQTESGVVTSAGEGQFMVHLDDGPKQFSDRDTAINVLEAKLTERALVSSKRAGAEHLDIHPVRKIREADVEGKPVFIEAEISITAVGRPRVAH